MKSYQILFVISFFLFPQLSTAQNPYQGKFGVNLENPQTWHFTDIVKTARAWETSGGQPLPASSYDQEGWPTTDFRTVLMDNRPVPEWTGSIDDPERFRVNYGGVYKGSFSGEANINLIAGSWNIQNKNYDPFSNKTTFDLVVSPPSANHGLIILSFTQTRRDSNQPLSSGITDLQIIQPGYDPENPPLFSDALINLLAGIDFAAIRGHPFTATTAWDITFPEEVEWEDRKTATFALQGSTPGVKWEDVCWEYFIQLCNETNTDMWINVPISASEDYITNLAQMIKDSLNEGLNIYVENDNEVWNTAPPFVNTNEYNAAEAASLGISEQENIARRAVEISQLFGNVFGQEEINQRIRVILASHAPMRKWWVLPMLNYIQSNFGPPKNYLYGISRQTYFRNDPNAGTSVDNIILSAKGDINEQIGDDPVNDSNRGSWAAFAAEWELPGGATSYEGGPHFPSGGGTANLGNLIRANRDQGMKELLQYNYANAWWDQGGGLAMHFTLTSGYHRYGCWGLTDDPRNPDRNFKYQAMAELVGSTTNLHPQSSSKSIKLYPNPSKGIVSIQHNFKEVEAISAKILDLSGKVLEEFEQIPSNSEYKISLKLATGIYIINFYSPDNQFISSEKLVITP